MRALLVLLGSTLLSVGAPSVAWAVPTIADCLPGDVPGGWVSNSCSSYCGSVIAGSVSCFDYSGADLTIYAVSGGSVADVLVFGAASTSGWCCRVTSNVSGDMDSLQVLTQGGDDGVYANGYYPPGGLTPLGQLSVANGVTVFDVYTRDGDDVVVGSHDPLLHENYYLGEGDDQAYGFEGYEIINGNGGNDLIYGGDGNDRLNAGAGDDIVHGGAGDDYIWGNDYAWPSSPLACVAANGSDNDQLWGEDGNDKVYGCHGKDMIDGGPGADQLFGYDGLFVPSAGACTAGPGDDGADLIYGGTGADNIDGCHGDDEIIGGAMAYGPTGDRICDADAAGLDGADHILGGAGADDIKGCKGNDVLEGGSGADTIAGNQGADQLWGGAGRDLLLGQQDNDQLFGGDDPDVMDGGAGNDLLCDNDTNDAYQGGADNDTLWHDSTLVPASVAGGANTDSCRYFAGVTTGCESYITTEPPICALLTY